MAKTNIEWSDSVWNPISGCSRKSAGCEHCYAEVMTKRLALMGQEKYQGLLNEHNRFNGVIKFDEKALLIPLKTKKPTTYFVNSMSDLFHENVKDEWIDKVFAVMALAKHHTFQILTKRADRMKEYLSNPSRKNLVKETHLKMVEDEDRAKFFGGSSGFWTVKTRLGVWWDVETTFPLQNVWLGVSVENQKAADERIPLLLETPAAVRWLSCEPLLENLNLNKHWSVKFDGRFNGKGFPIGRNGIDWVVVGGESGLKARVCQSDWIRSIVNQCQSAKVPVFVKQLGENFWMRQEEWRAMSAKDKHLLRTAGPNEIEEDMRTTHFKIFNKNKKGGEISEFPIDLQIREFPTRSL